MTQVSLMNTVDIDYLRAATHSAYETGRCKGHGVYGESGRDIYASHNSVS